MIQSQSVTDGRTDGQTDAQAMAKTLNILLSRVKYQTRIWIANDLQQKRNGVFTRSSKQKKTSSKIPANLFKIHVLMLDVCWIV